jgi:hypothetical protein
MDALTVSKARAAAVRDVTPFVAAAVAAALLLRQTVAAER